MFELDEEPGVDLTPLIDVVFMLLIFFIMTTTFSKPVLDIVLPKAEEGETAARHTQELVIAIRADGSLYYRDQVLDRDGLAAVLGTEREALLNLHVDEKAPFESFVMVADLAKQKREGRFVISTQPAVSP